MAEFEASDSESVICHILKLSVEIFRGVKIGIPPEWLTSDMTVSQLRMLLLLHTEGPSPMSAIAATIGTSLPTVTGTMDLLVKKGLVARRRDQADRRRVICALEPSGAAMMDRLWHLGREQVRKLLEGLSPAELCKAREVAEFLSRGAATEPAR